jgi:nicotinamide-nucleotide amidase
MATSDEAIGRTEGRVVDVPRASDLPVDEPRLSEIVAELGLTVGVAESLTGGALSASFARMEGSGSWFRGGVVAYSRAVKHEVLGVPEGPVVSERSAAAMAEGAVRLLGADVAVSVTGVGGPDRQDGEPPGTVWMAVSHAGRTTTHLHTFDGEPEDIVDATCQVAMRWLLEELQSTDDRLPRALGG